MGCVQAKSSINSPIQRIDKLKQNNGYYKRERVVGPINPKQPGNGEGERDKVVGRESGREKRVVPTKIGGEELVDGWPRWLADNIPRDVLAGLVPRSADSYDKLAKFFTSSPLPCYIPPPRKKQKDESQTRDLKKHKTYKEKQYYQRNYGHRGKEIIELGSGDFESSKEEKDAEHKYSHVIINSASSSYSGSKFTGHEVSLPASLSPFIRSLQKRSPKTEAHPNALKNIKNINKDYTLLQASIKGIINPNEGYKLSQRSRSLSTLDFRNLDQERISKLYRFNKDQAFKNDAFFFLHLLSDS